MAEQKSSGSSPSVDEPQVEMVDVAVKTVDNDSSKKELTESLRVSEDAKLHPAGEPDSETEKEPGGGPATDPNRPPFATHRSDTAILTSLATGAGQHTPPDPGEVDGDGNVRPVKMEAENKK